jgi:hypothetical protein
MMWARTDPTGRRMVKRTLEAMAIGYIVLGLINLGLERAGALHCVCEPECWCKRPGLNTFRWVFPHGHRLSGST